MTQWMDTMVFIDVINKNDIIAQVARCTFDVHAQDIMGTLIIGGTLIMLHPGGVLDFDYLATVFEEKQITYIQAVPSLLQAFFTFLIETRNFIAVKYFRSVCPSGEHFSEIETYFSHTFFHL